MSAPSLTAALTLILSATAFDIVWDVDLASNITTPTSPVGSRGFRVLRGDRGLPANVDGNNGNATNVYGRAGDMPHFSGNVPVNGGLPQLGNLTLHLTKFRVDLEALIPNKGISTPLILKILAVLCSDLDYTGYCLLDFEFVTCNLNSAGFVIFQDRFWRADWNSTPPLYRSKSIENTNGNISLAQVYGTSLNTGSIS